MWPNWIAELVRARRAEQALQPGAPLARYVADRAVDSAAEHFVQLAVPGLRCSVQSIFWYGAVDLDTSTCTVWVLLTGEDSTRFPPWLGLTRLDATAIDSDLPPETLAWLVTLNAELLSRFAVEGWTWEPPRVLLESSERVAQGGGWAYFK